MLEEGRLRGVRCGVAVAVFVLLGGCAQGNFDDTNQATFGVPAGGSDSGAGTEPGGPGSGSNASTTGSDSGPDTTTAGATDSSDPPDCVADGDCDDEDACTVDACTDGSCVHDPRVCDDGIECTIDMCDPVEGCQPMADDTLCDDGDACNGTETCDLATGCGLSADAVTCDDGNACTANVCEPTSGACSHPPLDVCTNDDGCCVPGCTVQQDNDCTCDNIAPMATPTSSGGGVGAFGPPAWIDGVTQSGCELAGCSGCFGWITNNASTTGAFMELQWPSDVVIGSMVLDTDSAAQACSTFDRRTYTGSVEYFDGVNYVEATTWTAVDGDLVFDFSPPLTTSRLRLHDIVTPPGGLNSLAYEWYVYTPSGCRP